jgi:hypothetical protein
MKNHSATTVVYFSIVIFIGDLAPWFQGSAELVISMSSSGPLVRLTAVFEESFDLVFIPLSDPVGLGKLIVTRGGLEDGARQDGVDTDAS